MHLLCAIICIILQYILCSDVLKSCNNTRSSTVYYLEKVFLTNLADFPEKHVYLKTCRIGTSTVIWKSPSQAFAMNSAKFFRTAKHFFLEECYSFRWASIFLIFSDLSLNIFLKYSYINFTINCIRKSSHQKKSHFRQNKHIERS